MMLWVLVIIMLLLLAGPLRRPLLLPLLAAWRFTFPAALGLVGGFVFSAFLVSFGLPAWTMLVLPPMVALQVGAGAKAWLDENLGPPRR